MELIETLRNIAVREGFEAGHSIQDISDETGLPVLEVFQREKDLHLIPANEAYAGSTPRPPDLPKGTDRYPALPT